MQEVGTCGSQHRNSTRRRKKNQTKRGRRMNRALTKEGANVVHIGCSYLFTCDLIIYISYISGPRIVYNSVSDMATCGI